MDLGKERIAVVSSSFPPLGCGGVTSSHYNLLAAFERRGLDVHGFTFNDGGQREGGTEPRLTRSGLPAFFSRGIHRVLSLLLRLSGETGNLYQFSDALIGGLAGAFLVGKIRCFSPRTLILPDHGAPGAFMPKAEGCKRIIVSHHNPIRFLDEPLIGAHSRRDSELALLLEKRALSKADGVICPSVHMKEIFLKTFSFQGEIAVIPNLINQAFIDEIVPFPLRDKFDLPAHAPVVYIPSAGSVYKGSAFVPEIVRSLASAYGKDIGFYLSGEVGEPLARALESAPRNVRIVRPGRVSHRENLEYVKACTLCVSPTLIESFGMAILEAQACYLPTVAFDAGGNRGLVREGETGYFVPRADLEGLTGRVAALLSNEGVRRAFAAGAAAHVQENFNEKNIVDRYLQFFGRL